MLISPSSRGVRSCRDMRCKALALYFAGKLKLPKNIISEKSYDRFTPDEFGQNRQVATRAIPILDRRNRLESPSLDLRWAWRPSQSPWIHLRVGISRARTLGFTREQLFSPLPRLDSLESGYFSTSPVGRNGHQAGGSKQIDPKHTAGSMPSVFNIEGSRYFGHQECIEFSEDPIGAKISDW